jgi:hypothetical protein
MRCMICGKGVRDVDRLSRVNAYGQTPAIWACDPHAAKALRAYADAKGLDAVREDLRKYVDPAMQFQRQA